MEYLGSGYVINKGPGRWVVLWSGKDDTIRRQEVHSAQEVKGFMMDTVLIEMLSHGMDGRKTVLSFRLEAEEGQDKERG